MEGVEDEAASSPLVSLPFITGHDPFEQMAVTAVNAEHFCRRQGGAKEKLFCNVVTNSGC